MVPAYGRWTGDPSAAADSPATLADLAAVVQDHPNLHAALQRVAELAVRSVEGADGAGLALLVDGLLVPSAGSSRFAADADLLQHGLGRGPGWTAVAVRRPVVVDAVGTDRRWPDLGAEATALDLGSLVAVALLTGDEVVGCLSLYARAAHAFGPAAVAAAERFARPASVAVGHVQLLASTRAVAAAVHQVLTGRVSVDRAVGVLVNRSGITPEEATEHLTDIAADQRATVVTVARSIVADAAVWRHCHPGPGRWPVERAGEPSTEPVDPAAGSRSVDVA